MYVRLPLNIDCYGMFVRSMCLQYDHLSDTCPTYQPPEVPQLFRQGKQPYCRLVHDHLVLMWLTCKGGGLKTFCNNSGRVSNFRPARDHLEGMEREALVQVRKQNFAGKRTCD